MYIRTTFLDMDIQTYKVHIKLEEYLHRYKALESNLHAIALA